MAVVISLTRFPSSSIKKKRFNLFSFKPSRLLLPLLFKRKSPLLMARGSPRSPPTSFLVLQSVSAAPPSIPAAVSSGSSLAPTNQGILSSYLLWFQSETLMRMIWIWKERGFGGGRRKGTNWYHTKRVRSEDSNSRVRWWCFPDFLLRRCWSTCFLQLQRSAPLQATHSSQR